jgi:spermidine/putrescine transport system ATP-binding protein
MATAKPGHDVELRGVTKRFDDVTAVDDIDLDVRHGEFLSLLGPSGCGKTTTLRLIAGFEQPDEGEILIDGENVAGRPPYKRDVNTVFQSYALFPHLSVLDNVAYGLRQRGDPRGVRQGKAREALELVRLAELGERKPRQLSGGQQQRVALARALVMEPKVLLLDEPLGALDLKVRKQLQIELKRIQERVGITFVYVTHDQEEALAMSDRVAVMNEGRIEQLGAPREIYDAPATSFVADFIGETNFIGLSGRTLAVRPERIAVRRPSPAGADLEALEGEVLTAMMVGPALQWLVKTDDGQEVLVRQPRSGGNGDIESIRVGDRVVVSWADDAALELATGGEGGRK